MEECHLGIGAGAVPFVVLHGHSAGHCVASRCKRKVGEVMREGARGEWAKACRPAV